MRESQSAYSGTPFANFQPVSADTVKKVVLSTSSKSCENDPIPTHIVKDCINELLPAITCIVNQSLNEGHFPDTWKEALVRPKLKKTNLDLVKKNYRLVSNLVFISKVTERIVAQQISQHLCDCQLLPELQSAYRTGHSTETALLRVCNDILMNMNKQHVTLLVCLDLSSAFDTVDHDVLLKRLENNFGIGGTALTWFQSYLKDRSQRIVIQGAKSASFNLKYGVPQGSCLGSLLFSLYASELLTIVSHHLPTPHCYADDTQLYLAFKPDALTKQDPAVAAMEACLRDIRQWMIRDKLMINDEKTEFMMIGTRAQLAKVHLSTLTVGEAEIVPNEGNIGNIGVLFDNTLSIRPNVNMICKTGYYYLRNIKRIRKYLSKDSAEKLIHAFVTSRLDNCNSLLYGLPACTIAIKLQRLQNAAARTIMQVPKFCHISPIVSSKHWLPVKYRIDFKIILTTFKAIHGLGPKYLSELLHFKHNSNYSLRSNNMFLLSPPKYKTLSTLGDRVFAAAAPRLWNTLPETIRNTHDLITFKRLVKTFFFKQAYCK